VTPAPAPAAAPPPGPRDISWTGLIGGLLGFLFPSQSAVYTIVWPGDASRLSAIPLFLVALIYVPAVWVSLFRSPRRQRVLRTVLVVSLPLVVLGIVFFGPAFATLLLVPSTLLAVAAGLVFQGRQDQKGRGKREK